MRSISRMMILMAAVATPVGCVGSSDKYDFDETELPLYAAYFDISPGNAVTVDGRECEDICILSITNNNETGTAYYTISVNGDPAVEHSLEPGESDRYELGASDFAVIANTGDLTLEGDFE